VVLLHEVLHQIMDHHRRAERIHATPKQFNVAADMEVNSILQRDGLGKHLPQGACLPSKMGLPEGLTAEEYYELLQKQQPEPEQDPQDGEGDGDGNESGTPADGNGKPQRGGKPAPGQGRCGSVSGGEAEDCELPADDPNVPAQSPVQAELLRRAVAQDIQKAAGRGSVPAGLARYAEAVLAPAKVPWREVLASQLRAAVDRDVGYEALTYARPGRLSYALGDHGGAMFQSWYAPRLTVGVVVDTSGSMSSAAVASCIAETAKIIEATGAEVFFTSVDTNAATVVAVEDVTRLVLQGGGGTDMRVGISAMAEHKPKPDVVVVMSDCDTPWPAEPTEFPLIICAITASNYAIQRLPNWTVNVIVED
jgi:predicted metal-dependent peptidase